MSESVATVPETTVGEGTTTSKWDERVGAFAKATGKSPDEVSKALAELAGTPGDDALVILADPAAIGDGDLQEALVRSGPRIPLGVFRKHVSLLRGQPSVAASALAGAVPSMDALPPVPDDKSFIEALKIGGILKVGMTDVLAAMRAGIASQAGMFDLPEIIRDRMERFADEQQEPVGDAFWAIHKLTTERGYGDILTALGVPGRFMSEKRKTELLARLNSILWPALKGFHNALISWQESYMATSANPAMALSILAMAQAGAGTVLPPGMMQPPDTAGLRDEAESVINRINLVFSGTGIPVARALAYDATRIRGILEEPNLPATIGATNREQMLKMLGVSVGADFVRLERNIVRYGLAVAEFPKVSSGNAEYAYLAALLQLGAQIPWDSLPGVLRGDGEARRPLGLGRGGRS